jgi:hypothetical protein
MPKTSLTARTARKASMLLCSVSAATLFVGLPAHGQERAAERLPVGGSAIIPAPEPPFGGVIGRTARESKPSFPKAVTAPEGAPNVLVCVILVKSAGYSDRSRPPVLIEVGHLSGPALVSASSSVHCAGSASSF